MAQTFTGRKRVRKFFGKIEEVAEMPNLIEVQKASYDQFLLVKEPPGGRPDEGLQAVFRSVFPISDFSNTAQLEFVRYEFEAPKYDVDECRQRLLTFGWSVGETGGASTWLVTGTNGEHTIHAEGRTQSEAWWRACVDAREMRLLGPAREGGSDG